ncbi:MAG: chromosome segregation protein, partial [Actinomycetota bacterium]|nr:chromosome segregation protein [Actinomycetota bacterium]
RVREAEVEEALAFDAPLQVQAQDTYVALSGLRERYAGLRSVALERVRHAESVQQTDVGPDPDELDQQAARLRAEDAQLREHLAGQAQALQAAEGARAAAQRALAEQEAQVAAARRAVADRREGLARLRGKLAAATSRAETRASEIERLEQAHAEALLRAEAAQRDFAEVEAGVGGLASGEEDLDAVHAAAQEVLEAAEEAVERLRSADAAAGRDEAALSARIDALATGLERKDGTATVLAAADELSGVLGSVAALVHVEHGYEVAVGAALGALADGAAVADPDAAVAALARVGGDEGRAHLLVGADDPAVEAWPELGDAAVYAIDVVRTEPRLRAALARILRRVVIVADLGAAREVVAVHDVVAVTRHGDVLGRAIAAGGRVESLLEVQAAIDEARAELAQVVDARERQAGELAAAGDRRDHARAAVDAALERLHESDAQMAAVAEQLGALGSAARAAQDEAARLVTAVTKARAAANEDSYAVEQLQQRLAVAEAEPEAEEPAEDGLGEHKGAVEAAQAVEVEARLAVRTAEERHRAVVRRAQELEAAASKVRADRARLAEQRRRQQQAAAVAADVLVALDIAEPEVAQAVARAQQQRQQGEQVKAQRDSLLRTLRSDLRSLAAESAQLNDSVHRDELAKAQQRMRIEAAQERALTEFGVDPRTLVAEYGPDQLIPSSAVPAGDLDDHSADEVDEATPYVRAEQEARAKRAERDLVALGRVNPLALEEFAALQERQAFLTEQLEDLKKGRDDLLGIIADVDERVREVFAEAYRDVAEQFEQVFARLFPGGEGRLMLTDPSDMLTTGVEVEARPAGKRVKRLSLLSGGERSLTAVAFLVALFKARPSPFYLLDEVEAALDDVNLGRLLEVLEELRATSQLLVITHQKRSMEVADALYGVTMRDGVTSVISQRLREAV